MKNLGQVTENQDIARKQDIPTNYVPTSRTVNGKALSSNISLTASDVGALPSSTEIPKIYYGTSSTNSITATKVVSCADFLSLEVGAIITVRFTYGNAAQGPTLNVNGTGAKSIRYRNASSSLAIIFWAAYDSLTFRYSGTYWDLIGNLDTNTTYTLSSFGVTATSTELNYCDGVTSNIQTQLDAKADSSSMPTKTSDLENDSGFITSDDLPSSVTSVVGQTGDVTKAQLKTGLEEYHINGGGFCIGTNSSATYGGAIGNNATETGGGFAGGNNATVDSGGSLGYASSATTGGAVGLGAEATTGGAVGASTQATTGFAGGYNAKATANGAVQLGEGTNSTANTFQYRSYQLLNASGKIPSERLNITVPTKTSDLTNDSGFIAETSFSKSTTGYLQLSNGFIIQWKKVPYSSYANPTWISFPKQFPNACLGVVISQLATNTTGNDVGSQHPKIAEWDNTNVKITSWDVRGITIIAVGY